VLGFVATLGRTGSRQQNDEVVPTEAKQYEVINNYDIGFQVYIPPEFANDFAVYQQACREICAGRDNTVIQFWNDRSKMPVSAATRMTTEQNDAEVAVYWKNTDPGDNNFVWHRNGVSEKVGPVY